MYPHSCPNSNNDAAPFSALFLLPGHKSLLKKNELMRDIPTSLGEEGDHWK